MMTAAKEEIVFEILPVHSNLETILKEYKHLASNKKLAFFLSYGWIETWLELVPPTSELYFVQGKREGKTVLAFFAGARKIRRRTFFAVNQLCLNISGQDELDNLCIEYNRFLYREDEFDLQQLIAGIPLSWEEIIVPALDSSSLPAKGLATLQHPFRYVEDRQTLSRYVDLRKVREAHGDFLSLVSGNIRAQIRRSIKQLNEIGPLTIHIPGTFDDAITVFDELTAFHQETWNRRREAGAFAAPLFYRFHHRLLEKRFSAGEIQLIKISVGHETLGCIYNLLSNGAVYFYQSGLNYGFGTKIQPGLVCHALAIRYNAGLGFNTYDFLADDCRYKKSLATDANTLKWGRIQRRSAKFAFENFLYALVVKFRKKFE